MFLSYRVSVGSRINSGISASVLREKTFVKSMVERLHAFLMAGQTIKLRRSAYQSLHDTVHFLFDVLLKLAGRKPFRERQWEGGAGESRDVSALCQSRGHIFFTAG